MSGARKWEKRPANARAKNSQPHVIVPKYEALYRRVCK